MHGCAVFLARINLHGSLMPSRCNACRDISSPSDLDQLRNDIRRLHQAAWEMAPFVAVSGIQGCVPILLHDWTSSFAGCFETQMVHALCFDRSSKAIQRSDSGSASARPASAAKEGLLPAPEAGDALLDAELAAARSDRVALLDLLSSKAVLLLQSSMHQHRAALATPDDALSREGEPAATVSPLPPRLDRAQSAHAGSVSAGASRGSSSSGVAVGASCGNGSSYFPAPASSIASTLLESTSLLREMRVQASGREASQRAAAERASEMKAKYDCAQQDVTMLRNIVGELQGAGSLGRARPATAGQYAHIWGGL